MATVTLSTIMPSASLMEAIAVQASTGGAFFATVTGARAIKLESIIVQVIGFEITSIFLNRTASSN